MPTPTENLIVRCHTAMTNLAYEVEHLNEFYPDQGHLRHQASVLLMNERRILNQLSEQLLGFMALPHVNPQQLANINQHLVIIENAQQARARFNQMHRRRPINPHHSAPAA